MKAHKEGNLSQEQLTGIRFISTLNNGKCFILRDLFILNYGVQ